MSPQTIIDAARLLVDALLVLLPAPAAKQMIDDAAVRRGHAVREAIENAKFGPEKP